MKNSEFKASYNMATALLEKSMFRKRKAEDGFVDCSKALKIHYLKQSEYPSPCNSATAVRQNQLKKA